MDALYVCLFTNGHIKVGRSIDPQSRIAAHEARVACMGVQLSDHFVVECNGPSEPREADLIGLCAANATERYQSEWFSGLDFLTVCEWAAKAAVADYQHIPQTRWSRLLRDLKVAGKTQMQIAAECECNQSTISALSNGRATEPLFSLGEKLIALHQRASVAKAA